MTTGRWLLLLLLLPMVIEPSSASKMRKFVPKKPNGKRMYMATQLATIRKLIIERTSTPKLTNVEYNLKFEKPIPMRIRQKI